MLQFDITKKSETWWFVIFPDEGIPNHSVLAFSTTLRMIDTGNGPSRTKRLPQPRQPRGSPTLCKLHPPTLAEIDIQVNQTPINRIQPAPIPNLYITPNSLSLRLSFPSSSSSAKCFCIREPPPKKTTLNWGDKCVAHRCEASSGGLSSRAICQVVRYLPRASFSVVIQTDALPSVDLNKFFQQVDRGTFTIITTAAAHDLYFALALFIRYTRLSNVCMLQKLCECVRAVPSFSRAILR